MLRQIGHWQFGIGRLRIQNNTMICLSDHKTINPGAQLPMPKATFIESAIHVTLCLLPPHVFARLCGEQEQGGCRR